MDDLGPLRHLEAGRGMLLMDRPFGGCLLSLPGLHQLLRQLP
ncbi:MAG: hypothetical protein RLZZ32_333, partial [Cyanobacteriota bacterium]